MIRSSLSGKRFDRGTLAGKLCKTDVGIPEHHTHMKLKAYLLLVVLSCGFVIGGLYITATMHRVVANLQEIALFRQMAFQSKELLSQIKEVRTDLLLKDTHHAVSPEVIFQHQQAVVASINGCFSCHHPGPIAAKIRNLQTIFAVYQEKLAKAYALTADDSRLPEAEGRARAEERHLQSELDTLRLSSGETVSTHIGQARQAIAASQRLLLLFVTIGPVVILLFSLYFFSRFTHALNALGEAFKKVEDGDLDFRIEEKLDDEFQQLAKAFNEMNLSLKEQGRRVVSMQQRYQLLFENAGDAIFIMQTEGADAGRIVSANQAAADMHGYSVEELLEMGIRDLDEPESSAQAPGRIRRILDGEWLKFQALHRKKDGSVFPVEASAGLLECDGQRYIMAFDRDITRRVLADAALQRARQLAIVGEMAAGIAHEIKNPLAGIKVSIEVLAAELALDQEDKEVLLRVIQEVNRIETLLKNLLSYARPPKPHFDRVDLNELLAISLRNAKLTLKSPNYFAEKMKEITFTTEFASGVPLVQADSSQLQQIFLNLLLNCIEAISESGTISVRSDWDQVTEQVRVTIADTGKGFSEEGLLKLFQPFYTTKSKGNGLGLAITKRLVELHHGRIELLSGAGEGAVFVVTLNVKHQAGGSEQ